MEKKLIGEITHFYPRISVAVVALKSAIKIGDKIGIEGHGNSFEQEVESMQLDMKPIKEAKAKQEIAIKVNEEVKPKDQIFKLA